MIDKNEGIIIVMGMAHSGTTILTYLLKQHPDVFCFVDSKPFFLLENTLLPERNSKRIKSLLWAKPNKRLLLKRLWATYYTDWLLSEMPEAKYIYCQRPFEEIAVSWRKPGSYINGTLRDGSVEFQRGHYEHDIRRSEEFEARAKHFKRFDHNQFLADPTTAMNALGEWLGLSAFVWDVSKVSKENIKTVIQDTVPTPTPTPTPRKNRKRTNPKVVASPVILPTPVIAPVLPKKPKNVLAIPIQNTPTPIPARNSPKVVKSKLSRKG